MEFKIKENEMPSIRLIKKCHATFGGLRSPKFQSESSNLFINEMKLSRRSIRQFVISVLNIGEHKDLGKYKQSQIHIDYNELLELRDNINKILEYNNDYNK